MIYLNGKKMTARQWAREILIGETCNMYQNIDMALEESNDPDWAAMTQREQYAVMAQITKLANRMITAIEPKVKSNG